MRKSKPRKQKRSSSDFIFDTVTFIILTLVFVITAYPLYFILISSISNPTAVAAGDVVFLPIGFTFDGYLEILEHKEVLRGFINSIIITVVGTSINLFLTLPTGYALSRPDFFYRKFVTYFYIITMFVNGGMIPTYLVVQQTGLIDTIWALIIPGAVSVFNMFVARTFFKTNIPKELLEAGLLDGCTNFKFFIKVALPLSGSLMAVLALYYGVGHWNAYFNSLLYITTPKKFPLQLVLRNILIDNSLNQSMSAMDQASIEAIEKRRELVELMKYSLIVFSSIPVMLVFPFIQKHFVKGVMIGSVKG
ncbi:MAG: carbohydrate ABC transporter permease [Lachnospirales bacterium]